MARIRYKEAIGLKAGRGRPAIGKMPDKENLKELYIEEFKSAREVAEVLRCSKDMVLKALSRYGIEVRTKAKRSKLLKYSLSELKEGAKEKGIRGYARELGVNPSTLSRFLRLEKEK